MPFVGDIFAQLKTAQNCDGPAGDSRWQDDRRDRRPNSLSWFNKARTFLVSKSLKKGDRIGLLAANSIRWIAMDLAAMAEGLIVVPLYFRQAPAELVAMMKDSTPALICCGDADAARGNSAGMAGCTAAFLFDEIFAGVEGIDTGSSAGSR